MEWNMDSCGQLIRRATTVLEYKPPRPAGSFGIGSSGLQADAPYPAAIPVFLLNPGSNQPKFNAADPHPDTASPAQPIFAMSTVNAPVVNASKLAGKYLTVVLENEAYGIAVLKVREIIRMQKITPVPQMPGFVKGVINLRGRVIPVVDLRVKFDLKAEFAERTCIVVVQVKLPTEQIVQMGLIVDSVEEVVTLTNEEIEPTPDFGTKIDTSYLLGMAKVKGQEREAPTAPSVISRLLTDIFFWTGLTPELSRTALRPWASETQWYLHEAAKRARLERIVRRALQLPT